MSKKKEVVFIGPVADGSCPKCNVGTAILDHTCPYTEEFIQTEVEGEDCSSCDCCEVCIQDCQNDI
jgi:hypothetical protein